MSHLSRRPTDRYVATIRVEGVDNLVYPPYLGPTPGPLGWDWALPETVEELQASIWRTGTKIGVPGCWLIASVLSACRSSPDPRNPRQSARALYDSGLTSLTKLALTKKTRWDQIRDINPDAHGYLTTKYRLCLNSGWVAIFNISVTLPEYITAQDLHAKLIYAGTHCGLGEARPHRAKFHVTSYETGPNDDL